MNCTKKIGVSGRKRQCKNKAMQYSDRCKKHDGESRVILPDEKPIIQDVELDYEYVVICTGCVHSSCIDNSKLEVLPDVHKFSDEYNESWLFTSDKDKMIAITKRSPGAIERADKLYNFMKGLNCTENCIAFDGVQKDYGYKTIHLKPALDYAKKVKETMINECSFFWSTDPINFKVITHKQLGTILYLDYRQ